jgi:hypothetical protein
VKSAQTAQADPTAASAEEVYEYLRGRGATLSLLLSINDVAGIDEQPGYRRMLAVDSGGNLTRARPFSAFSCCLPKCLLSDIVENQLGFPINIRILSW